MRKSYKTIMVGGCAVAVLVGVAYLAIAMLAIGDGDRYGVEIPSEISVIAMTTVMLGGIVGAVAWVVDQANRTSAARDVQPLIRAEVERTMTALVPEVASAVAEQVNSATARRDARMREVVTLDLVEVVESALNRAHRAGIIQQAQNRAGYVPAPHPAAATGTARVARHLHMTMTSEDN